MNRAERRALEFRGIKPTPKPSECKTIQEQDGVIWIPEFDKFYISVLPYMVPLAQIPEQYFQDTAIITDGVVRSAKGYRGLLSTWFFSGLSKLEITFREQVRSNNPKGVEYAFLRYVHTLLNSRDASHGHKMAYLTWVLDQCCTQIVWTASR